MGLVETDVSIRRENKKVTRNRRNFRSQTADRNAGRGQVSCESLLLLSGGLECVGSTLCTGHIPGCVIQGSSAEVSSW